MDKELCLGLLVTVAACGGSREITQYDAGITGLCLAGAPTTVAVELDGGIPGDDCNELCPADHATCLSAGVNDMGATVVMCQCGSGDN